MKRTVLIIVLVVVTTLCMVIGCGIHIFGWGGYKGFFSGIGYGKAEEFRDRNIASFSSINVDLNISELTIKPGVGYELYYNCSKKLVPKYEIMDDILYLEQKKVNVLGPHIGSPKTEIVITVPKDLYLKSLNVESAVGDVEISNINADSAEIDTNVGELDIVSCGFNTLEIDADVGDVTVKECIFKRMGIETNVGEVKVKELSDINDYDVTVDTDIGEISVNGKDYKRSYHSTASTGDAKGEIVITSNVGDVTLDEK